MMRAAMVAVLVSLAAPCYPASAQNAAAPAAAAAPPAQDAPASAPALAPVQDTDTLDPTPPGTLNPQPLPPLANPNSPSTPAKELFARKLTPLPGPARPIGSYADGCLAGAVALPITGPSWQVMRLSRNRNWGKPRLVSFIERFGGNAKKAGWNGLLIGDMSQPRGGPMIIGPCQPSDRARRRYLVHADARSCAHPRRARDGWRRRHGRAGPARRRSQSVDTYPHRDDQGGFGGSDGDPHFRQCGDQKGNVQRGRNGPRLARKSATVVGTCRALSRPAELPAG